MTNFIANVAAVDYLSVGTFNPIVFNQLVETFVSCDILPDDTQRMQYLGQTQPQPDGSIFWGSGEQSGHTHYLIQVSGACSDRFIDRLCEVKPQDFNVTRLDVQITMPKPAWYKSRSFVDTLRGDVWQGRSRRVTMIDNYGDDTVYIGSRKSDRFARVYVKEGDWLRLEFEYKKQRADNAYRLIQRHDKKKTLAGILYGEVLKLPDHPIKTAYRAILAQYETVDVMTVKPESKRFKWFVKQCVPAIITLLNDHDSGDLTRAVLMDLINGEWTNE